ncbi:carboxymuconolactone decarboxylase family protein [Streptomyces sp. NBC_00859]|uniref:carboxymuconolactone decarboxylase family protein n=1 Tax=Streptomyces sp. NBC_00859 TaxID=2903682 RepID=UPI0038684818|nr:carboxymuconolactone decarboxylase family protein [Streptomyces sp. NBC_00859]
MASNTPKNDEHSAGGRLRLLARAELDAEQVKISDRLTLTRVARGRQAGYRTALDDGRFVGPFNALLRAPDIAERQLDWAEAISAADLHPAAREVAILTVAAQWRAEYVLYAHSAAARGAGLSDDAIDDLVAARTPAGLDRTARLAHAVALALVQDHDIPDDLYGDFLSEYGETGAVVLISLIGQYLATCAVTTCFRVPVPGA